MSGPPETIGKRRAGTARRARLAGRRKALGLTQEALAALLNVERSTVVRWERGDTDPQAWMRPRLAKALRLSADGLTDLLDDGTPGTGVPGQPRQLPAAVPDFTGRAAELTTLAEALDSPRAHTPGTVVISAIGGTAGIGKTALALHWAHRVAERFPDGQLYVNFRGFAPADTPMPPEAAIREFLDVLVPSGRVPQDIAAQAALYCGLLADRRMLIVLDNVRDEQQARPLLPASPGSIVVITSRSQLTGLAATHGARLLSLDVLTRDEAIQLLTARIGRARVAREPDAVSEIAELCACLPLALAVAAARAAAWPRLSLAALAAELRDTSGRLDALDTGDPAASVRSVFSWSYRQLAPPAARLFRLLGLHPGPDISVPAAASLAAADQPMARRLLRELTATHLLGEHSPGRYACHDLLRAYAADQAIDSESDLDRTAAATRLLDHYLLTAHAAAMLISPTREPIVLAPPGRGTTPEPIHDAQQAMAWFDAEHHVLLAAATFASSSGFDVHGWQIPWTMAFYLQRRGHWHAWRDIQERAVAAATRLGDDGAQAISRRLLAQTYTIAGDYEQARTHLQTCIQLYQRTGDLAGEASTHQVLGSAAVHMGRFKDALGHAEYALRLYRATGNESSVGEMLNNIGWSYSLLGDYQQARAFGRRALAIAIELGQPVNEAYAWDSLGYAEQHLGDLTEATACFERSLAKFRSIGFRKEQATTLTHLGEARLAVGDLPGARGAWREALSICEDLGHPDADQVRAKLAELGD